MSIKQMSLFEDVVIPKKHHAWKLCVDGASRNNPGPAGAGIYILKDNQVFAKHGYYLGTKTNNQAEYLALLVGIFLLKKQASDGDTIEVISDSQLLIRQMKGEYRVKNEDLKALHGVARRWLEGLRVKLSHVMREDNVEADAMANHGVDKKQKVPQAFIEALNREISSI